jgi:hypothetical protein
MIKTAMSAEGLRSTRKTWGSCPFLMNGRKRRPIFSTSVTWLPYCGQVLHVLPECLSVESVVIQRWWPDSERVTNVDAAESQTLRPQPVAISE